MSKANTSKRILKLKKFLPYRVSVLSNAISSIVAKTYQNKFQLSVTEWRIMALLAEHPGSAADEISLAIQVEKSIISRALKRMLKRDLVRRNTNKVDRRRQDLFLTDLGFDVYAQIVPLSFTYEKQLLEVFSIKERKQFYALIDKLYARAQELQKE